MRAGFLPSLLAAAVLFGAACSGSRGGDHEGSTGGGPAAGTAGAGPGGGSARGGNTGKGGGGPTGGGRPTGGSGPGSGGNPGTGGSGGSGGDDPGTGGTGPTRDCTAEEPGPRVLRLLTRWEYSKTVGDLLGVDPPDVTRVAGMGIVDGFDNDVRANVVTDRHIDIYMALAEELVAQAIVKDRGKFVPCQAGCEKDVVKTFGRAAFRRPLTDEEVNRYAALFDSTLTGGKFEEGVKLAMQAMLVSPVFLYRSEIGEKQGSGAYDLTPHEMATTLAYTLWGTSPDSELNTAADKGELKARDPIEKQVRRMLASPKAQPQVVEFMRQWLGTKPFPYANKDVSVYPMFTQTIRDGMIKEEAAFLANVVFKSTKTYDELFTADYTFADILLGQYYGIQGANSANVEKVSLGAQSKRGGLLTLGALVSTHAHSAETSPIKRGVFVRRNLLCQALANPPADVDTTPPGLDPTLSTRERFAKHTSNPKCASCHSMIDGVGFGFESFDAVGMYRTEEKNGTKTIPVDSKGWIIGLETKTDTRLEFNGPRELGKAIASSPTAHRCFAKKLYRFSRGYIENSIDRCAEEALETKFAGGKRDIQELIVSVILQDSFLHRREGEF